MRPFFNYFTDLVDYFSTSERRVTTTEFIEFWQSLSDEERVFYRFVPLI